MSETAQQAGPILSLDTKTRPVIDIDGEAYQLRHATEFSLGELHGILASFRRHDQVHELFTDAGAEDQATVDAALEKLNSIDAAIRKAVNLVLIDAAAAVSRLGYNQLQQIVRVFLQESGALSRPAEADTIASRDSSGSTAAIQEHGTQPVS